MKEEMISKVDRESFWQLIAEAKQRFPENMDAYEEWVKTQLKRMGTEETFNFFVIFYMSCLFFGSVFLHIYTSLQSYVNILTQIKSF